MPLSTSFRIVYRAANQFIADGATEMGAALAYYALFSTAPILVLAVMLSGLIFGEQAARDRVRIYLTEFVGPESAREVTTLMETATKPRGGTLAAVLGGTALVVGALWVFLQVRQSLCVIWRLDMPDSQPVMATLFNYLLSIIMVVCVGVLLLLSLAVSAVLPRLVDFLDKDFPVGARFWQGVDALVSFGFLFLFFGVVFRVMSAGRIFWHHVVYGAVITALLFTVGKTLIGLYLAYTSTASAYGAAGSLVVYLIWVYYSSLLTFFGAELVQARRTRFEWLPKEKV